MQFLRCSFRWQFAWDLLQCIRPLINLTIIFIGIQKNFNFALLNRNEVRKRKLLLIVYGLIKIIFSLSCHNA